MRRICQVFILLMMAVTAVSSAPAAIAVAASGRPIWTLARPVTGHIRVKATVPVGRQPFGIAVDPRTRRIYVAGFGSRVVSVISGRTDSVVARVRVGRVPAGVATDPRTNTVYVANEASDTVSVISGRTDTVAATIRVGRFPYGIATDPRTNMIYVTSVLSGTVSVISG